MSFDVHEDWIIVSINSTSEEVRRPRDLLFSFSQISIVSINSTSEEVRSFSYLPIPRWKNEEFPLIQLPRKSEGELC